MCQWVRTKYVAARCTYMASSCPVYCFLIRPAQLAEPGTLGYICGSSVSLVA